MRADWLGSIPAGAKELDLFPLTISIFTIEPFGCWCIMSRKEASVESVNSVSVLKRFWSSCFGILIKSMLLLKGFLGFWFQLADLGICNSGLEGSLMSIFVPALFRMVGGKERLSWARDFNCSSSLPLFAPSWTISNSCVWIINSPFGVNMILLTGLPRLSRFWRISEIAFRWLAIHPST